MTSKKSFQRLSQIFQDVEAICALDSLRSTGDSSCGFQMSFAKFQLSFAIERAAKLSWKSCPGEPSFILALAPTHSEEYARSLVLPVSARYVGEKVVR